MKRKHAAIIIDDDDDVMAARADSDELTICSLFLTSATRALAYGLDVRAWTRLCTWGFRLAFSIFVSSCAANSELKRIFCVLMGSPERPIFFRRFLHKLQHLLHMTASMMGSYKMYYLQQASAI